MKRILFAVLLALSPVAYADRSDDLVAGPAEDYCSVARNWYRAGMRNQVYGSKREFKDMPPAMVELLEHRVPLPKDGMYVPEWNGMTDKERSMLSFYVLAGYDAAAELGYAAAATVGDDAAAVAASSALVDKEIDSGAKEYYDSCIKHMEEEHPKE